MTNATNGTISISINGTWAGSGKLRDGVIEDCGAQFCDDNDKSDEVYGLIEAAVANGQQSLRVTLSDDTRHTITWTIAEAEITAQDYTNTHDHVICWYTSHGAPTGATIALLADTELPCDLSEITGTVVDGVFEATDLAGETDCRHNTLLQLKLYVDRTAWQREYDDYMAE